MKNLSEWERAIIGAHKAGATVTEIAARTGCTPMLVATVLGRTGVSGRRRGRAWPYDAETEASIARDYAGGATMAQLIQRHGGSNRTLHHVLEHRGVTIRNRGRRPRSAVPAPTAVAPVPQLAMA